MAKTKAHIRYKNRDGQIVPGVTTILGILAKPALIHWAWDLGMKGVDYRKYRDDKADIGTLAHYLIMCYLKNEKPDTNDYSASQIDQAENAVLSFYEWEKNHPLEPILVEEPLVSESFGYGGTADLVAKINGDVCLIDFKTGKGIYDDMLYQLAAYLRLVNERDIYPTNQRILRIGRDESEGFEERLVNDLSNQWQIFLSCLEIYNLKKKIKKGG